MDKGSPERKAILAGLTQTAAEENGDFLDAKLDRAWKKALKAIFAWKGKGEKTNDRLYQELRRDPTNEHRRDMLKLHDQYGKEGPRLLKAVEAIYAAAEKHPISEQSKFRDGKGNLDHAKHSFRSYDPHDGWTDPVEQMYKGSYGYQSLMSAIEHLAYARSNEGLPQAGR